MQILERHTVPDAHYYIR